jgi:sulfite reductase (NADPH) flavoprotein alpha-component
LAEYAKDSFQRAKLEWLGTEDKEGFKIRQLETYTFADVLQEFDSAQPPLEALMELIPALKPRHYSISSSMKMCPDSVHLLVVLVDWQTPKGRTRYGQCTRYMAGLDPADDVYLTVDIKPSAMHLPPNPSQPIIMAGLGTGMAPFRAFVQEREWQRQQGMEVGPVMLYFGSRHRHEEYLYGDFLDQMFEEKLITHLGLAFSRDQKEKVGASMLPNHPVFQLTCPCSRSISSTR